VSDTLERIRELVAAGKGRVSEHGFRELKEDAIQLANTLQGLATARVVEEYPDYHKGPCVLVLQRDAKGKPVHVLWGMSKAHGDEAVLITAYRPDPARWSADYLRRLPK
jgi:hypothetical protein